MIINVHRPVTIVTAAPTIGLLADMTIKPKGMDILMEWVRSRRPECLTSDEVTWRDLFPHDGTRDDGSPLSDNELLAEIAGRKCYNSFGLKAGRKSHREYIEHTQSGDVPHSSIVYHPKFSLFIPGISRRLSHELIRNYVGADRDEEGSPSQESTRFTEHTGHFILPPRILLIADDNERKRAIEEFTTEMTSAYAGYLLMIDRESKRYAAANGGKDPKGLERKRIYEQAANLLPGAAETSFIWSTNPMAMAKMIRERGHESADMEFRRLSEELRSLCMENWPNLFLQPWMQSKITWQDG